MLRKNHRIQAQLRNQRPIPLGGWSQPATAFGIETHDQVTILGIKYQTTIAKLVKDGWAGFLRR